VTDLPDPLVPLDCDLRGLQWMPYYGAALAGSEFNAAVSDAGYRAAHNLWWACWHQVPAASLPNDDIALARFADFGRDIRKWRKLKNEALHKFVLCNDGRLYHRFLSLLAVEAYTRRLSDRNRKKRWLEERVLSAPKNGKMQSRNAVSQSDDPFRPLSDTRSEGDSARARQDRTISLPSLKGRISHPAPAREACIHAREGSNGKLNDLAIDPGGRCAPLRGAAAPLRGKALAQHRKDQLVQKLMRFAIDTLPEQPRALAIEGLTGLDTAHSAQWWLDTLDQQMRAAKWDDTE